MQQSKKIDGITDTVLTRLVEVFRLACLLHDVGHAPFSHTGEEFYLDADGDYQALHTHLIQVVDNKGFEQDVPKDASQSAAPHEIMSAIVGLTNFRGHFESASEREFFARCITGYKYAVGGSINGTVDLKNCFILLLNSKIIDVDKLDYILKKYPDILDRITN